jgi:hypothetical protein
VVSDPKEIAILEHGLVLIDWYLSGGQRDIFKTSEEILLALHFSPEEIIAINVFFRKKRPMLESLKKEIEKKIAQGRGEHRRKKGKKKGVKINAGN